MALEPTIKLTHEVVNQLDIGRLVRELEHLEEFMSQAKVHKASEAKIPAPSKLLGEIAEANQLNLLQDADRSRLKQALVTIKDQAPVLHMSFAVDPPAPAVHKLVGWVRTNVHPNALLTIGLQPSLGAGFTLRTTNKYFDFSLREHLENQKGLLVQTLDKLSAGAQ